MRRSNANTSSWGFLLLALTAACGGVSKTPPAQPTAEPEIAPSDLSITETPEAVQPLEEPPVIAPEVVPDKLVLDRARYADMPGWQDDALGEALPALIKSCRRLGKKPESALVGYDATGGTVKQWKAACDAASRIDASDHARARSYFEEHFVPFLAKNHDDEQGRFTGYYEGSLRGSRKRHGRYQAPLYKVPDDLVMVNMRNFTDIPGRRRIAGRVVGNYLRPYPTRAEIRKGALRGKKLELVWIDDEVDGFFTQIQGSGLVELDDGSQMRIGYGGQNGHVYTAIGRELVRDGHITSAEMSMQAIRKWLAENPRDAGEMMDRNHAYVFFAELKANGPLGSQNVVLTPERSAAIDREFIPQSAPLFIDTTVPSEDGSELLPFRQMVIAQDSGGAIRGPVRADIFWGHGKRADAIAGRLKSKGRYFVLLPKEVAESIP